MIYLNRGFRLAKVNHETQRTTWYIRDASGNILSVYEQEGVVNEETPNTNELVQTEIPVYGSGKIGTYYPRQDGSLVNTTYPNGEGHFPVRVTVAMLGNKLSNGPKITVENIQNGVGIHEFLGHGFLLYNSSNGKHHKPYELQFNHPTWNGTTPDFKLHMMENYQDYLPRQ